MNVLLIIVLCIALLFLCFLGMKLFIIKIAIKEIREGMKTILESDTNNLLSVSTNDKDIKKLANDLNVELKDLRKQRLDYQNGNEELKNTITNISHDLRTPLTVISGYVDLLQEEELTEKQSKYVKVINNKTNELTNLTEELFEFSKSINTEKNNREEINCVNDVLEETIASYYNMFKENNIVPNINICTKKIYKKIDKNVLIRIFENLISNIIRYSDSDCNVVLQESGKLIFSNKASRLDVTTVKRIFDRYYTVENAKKNSGIGLSITKSLVELYDGSIVAKYKDGSLFIEIEL